MTRQKLVTVVRSLDEWHRDANVGNLRLRVSDGAVSMIAGMYSSLEDEPLLDTLTGTFGIDPARITCPEELFVDVEDVRYCTERYAAEEFQGVD